LPNGGLRDTPLIFARVFTDQKGQIFRRSMNERAEQGILYSIKRSRRVASRIVAAAEPGGFRRKFF
jgi:hypothetical protein